MNNNIIKGKSILTNVNDSYIGVLDVLYDQYSNNGIYLVKFPSTNTTTTPTLNLNSIGAGVICRNDGSALNIGQLLLNGWYQLMYDLPSNKFLILSENILIVKNTVYVMKNGSDVTGLVERFDKPFLTITAAINAIRLVYTDDNRNYLNRVRVIVEDGTYYESKISLYPYIDFDFGNSVIYTYITDYLITTTYSSNPNNDFTTKIFGNARIYRHPSAISPLVVTNYQSRVLCQCDTISSDRDDAVNIAGGYLRIICNKIYNNNTVNPFPQFSHAIELSQGGVGTAPFQPTTLDIVNADIYMVGNVSASTIHFGTAGGDSTSVLNQSLNLYNCRVINNLGSSPNNEVFSAIAVGSHHSYQQGGVINLYNTVLYSKYGKSIFVSNLQSKANITVYYYNLTNANTDSYLATPDANHSLTEYLKTTGFAINTDVLPIVP